MGAPPTSPSPSLPPASSQGTFSAAASTCPSVRHHSLPAPALPAPKRAEQPGHPLPQEVCPYQSRDVRVKHLHLAGLIRSPAGWPSLLLREAPAGSAPMLSFPPPMSFLGTQLDPHLGSATREPTLRTVADQIWRLRGGERPSPGYKGGGPETEHTGLGAPAGGRAGVKLSLWTSCYIGHVAKSALGSSPSRKKVPQPSEAPLPGGR